MKVTKKIERYLPMTKKQLAEIVECYATVFQGWELVNGQVFRRTHGPIVQHAGIEQLRYKAYRPWSGIRALPLPTVSMLHQFLDIKHKHVEFRAHPTKWQSVVTAMEQQFRPPIRKPLALGEIKELCEKALRENEDRESTRSLCMLAILNAYLGEKEQALSCCERMQTLPPPTLAPRLDWEQRHKEFGRELRGAIEAGNEREFLATAAERGISEL